MPAEADQSVDCSYTYPTSVATVTGEAPPQKTAKDVTRYKADLQTTCHGERSDWPDLYKVSTA